MEENWITKKLDEYRELYRGKFWNEGLSDKKLSETNWGTTDSGCYPNSCSSNTFGEAYQCYAFSLFLAYILFGSKITASNINSAEDGDVVCGGYTVFKDKDSIEAQLLEPGDIIRADGHSAMVWKVGDNTSEYPGVRFAECWGNPPYDPNMPPKGCYLNWHYFNDSADYTETVLKERATFLIKSPGSTIVPTTPDTGGENTQKVQVTFYKNTQSDGGPKIETREYEAGVKYGSFPSAGTRTGYTFDNWYTNRSGGTKVETFAEISREQKFRIGVDKCKQVCYNTFKHMFSKRRLANL